MKYVIISDLHSNLEALTAFQKSLKTLKLKYDKLVCLGDIAGYGANPNELVEWVRQNTQIALAGNHDYAIVGKESLTDFNRYAVAACRWTRKVLTQENKEYLDSLPPALIEDDIFWVHSSPNEPEEWHYLVSLQDGKENFPHFKERVCFVGHSHLPKIFEQGPDKRVHVFNDTEWTLKPDHRYIFNVGSMGQPRDGNPDPAYAGFESEEDTYQLKRFSYEVFPAHQKILDAELPRFLADRLAEGH